jgi:hypothetical protein
MKGSTKHLETLGNLTIHHRVGSLDGDKVCQMTLPREVRRIEAESAFLSRTKFSTGPTNSMYQRNGFRKQCGTSGTRQMQWKES